MNYVFYSHRDKNCSLIIPKKSGARNVIDLFLFFARAKKSFVIQWGVGDRVCSFIIQKRVRRTSIGKTWLGGSSNKSMKIERM